MMGRKKAHPLPNHKETNIIGTNLRRIRQERELRAADFVRKLQLCGYDITPGTYWKIEDGRNNSNIRLLILATEILGCDFNALLNSHPPDEPKH